MDGLLRCELDGSRAALRVVGELDVATAPDLEQAVDRALDGGDGELRLDLSELTFMDSTGAKALLRVHNATVARGRHFVLLDPAPRVRTVLELMGLHEVLDVEGEHA